MALYYLPLLIRSDRYFVAKLDHDSFTGNREETEFNFVAYADDRVMTPLITIEDPAKIVLNQMAPSDKQDILLRECHISMIKKGNDFELLITKANDFSVTSFNDEESGIRLDYSTIQKRITVHYYKHKVQVYPVHIYVTLAQGDTET